jgi:exopolysaccharide biosynthesis WecB/TagA/CpsF family protein
MRAFRSVVVGGVVVATASRSELTRRIIADCLNRRRDGGTAPPRLLFDANGHALSLAARDPAYARALEAADALHADGGSIVLASRFLSGEAIAERSATTDMIHDLAAAGVGHGIRHYLLGATEEVNASCARRLEQIHPGIVIAGRHHGYFAPQEEQSLIEDINASAADLLWIGLGKPREQLFAVRNQHRIRAGWAITCGGCFNYVTGHYRRAPRWMRDNHLEWLFRAVTTPKLLWRYATTSPHAVWLALRVRTRDIVND